MDDTGIIHSFTFSLLPNDQAFIFYFVDPKAIILVLYSEFSVSCSTIIAVQYFLRVVCYYFLYA